jgi:Tfp pilus assembly protein PilN
VPLEALIGISRKVPEGIWLLDLSISGGVLKLSGEGSSNPLVLEFIKGLGEIPYLKEVTPGIIREKDGVIVFSATCRIDL